MWVTPPGKSRFPFQRNNQQYSQFRGQHLDTQAGRSVGELSKKLRCSHITSVGLADTI
jgi:Mor family transcriptional regulator